MKVGPNAVLAFAIEMVALVVYGWAPFAFLDLPVVLELLAALALVTVFVALWALFAAPKSMRRLQGMALVTLKLALLLPAVVLLAWGRGWWWLVLGGAVVVANVVIEYRENAAPSGDA